MTTVVTPTTTESDAPAGLEQEIAVIRQLERQLATSLSAGQSRMLPGDVSFLPDGRVLCRDRARGDSRYPYGHDGFNFWVHASGRMYGNRGLFFVFLPFQDGQEPSIAFFLGQRQPNGEYLPLSLLPVPYLTESESAVTDRYTVLGHDAAYFAVQTPSVFGAVRVFVDQMHADHVDVAFSVYVENRTAAGLDLFTSAYLNPFCRHQFAETCEDRWFKAIHVEGQDARSPVTPASGSPELPPFVVAINEDVSRFRSVTNRALVRRATTATRLEAEFCTSRLGYVGTPRAGLAEAACLNTGRFGRQVPLTVFNDNAVIGDLNRLRLAPGASARFDYVLSLFGSDVSFYEELRTTIRGATVDAALRAQRAELESAPHLLDMKVSGCRLEGVQDDTLNGFLPFLVTQVRVCAETRGFMQPSPNSLIGIRDVFQAIEGHLYDQPQRARDKICEALSFVLTDGRCPRQYSLPVNGTPGRADLREFIDQGVWVVSTLYTYLRLTGDVALLNERLGYHKLSEAGIAPAEGEHGTILDHLVRIMGFLIQARDCETGLVRALYGDWNDAVDGLGTTSAPGQKFGSGVSVMVSLQLYHNCREMIEILQRHYPGQHLDLVRQYQQVQGELEAGLLRHAVVQQGAERRIVHGWGDKRGYYVGSFQDSDGLARDSLTSNAFWVLSGMLSKDQSLKPHILRALTRLDSRYGLKTFNPGFAPDAPGVGRVCKLPIGTAENGACYAHATLFGIMALFLLGEPQEAWQQIYKLLPFAPHQAGLSHSPFVMPNSYVYNEELNLTGQNMNDWQTGSSNVLLKLLIRHVFGFVPGFDALRIAPAACTPFDGFEFAATTHGRPIKIVYGRGSVARRRFSLNGAVVEGAHDAGIDADVVTIPYERLSPSKRSVIEVTDPIGGPTGPAGDDHA